MANQTNLCNGTNFIVAAAAAAEVLSCGLNANDINLLATFLSTVAADMFAMLACQGVEGTDA